MSSLVRPHAEWNQLSGSGGSTNLQPPGWVKSGEMKNNESGAENVQYWGKSYKADDVHGEFGQLDLSLRL